MAKSCRKGPLLRLAAVPFGWTAYFNSARWTHPAVSRDKAQSGVMSVSVARRGQDKESCNERIR